MRYSSVGITGPIYAGKTEIRRILEQLGYSGFSHSQILVDELQRRELQVDREHLTDLFQEFVDRYGHDVLARFTMDRVGNSGFAIDGLRHPAEINYYRQHAQGFACIAVDAHSDKDESRRIRYERMLAMERGVDKPDWDSFVKRDRSELGGVIDIHQISRCIQMADIYIINDGSLEDLRNQILKHV